MDVNMRDVGGAAAATGGGGDIDAIDDEDVLRQLVMFTTNNYNSQWPIANSRDYLVRD